jgi:hypothetical protein
LAAADGSAQLVEADHVIAATGYKVDVHRLPFLGPPIFERLRLVGKTPRLTINFESSVPGLYFVGQASSVTFGPVMRFVFGADFTSRTISKHLANVRPSRWREFSQVSAEQLRSSASVPSRRMPAAGVHLESANGP